jgi:hypothetical protein
VDSPVGSEVGRHAKPANPAGKKGVRAVLGGGAAQRNRLRPAGGAVHYGEHVCEAVPAGRKGATQVNMDMGEPVARTAIGCRGAFMCRTTLPAAQPWQSRHQAAASLAIPLHTYLLASNRQVARMPG